MHRIILALLLIGAQTYAAIYYVRNDGHDTASGVNNTTDGATGAWKTSSKACSTATAGDTIKLKDDHIWRETCTIATSGTVGNIVNYTRTNDGVNKPIISGADLLTTWTTTTSGTVTATNTRLSVAANTAFVGFNSVGKLTPYLNSQLVITASGKSLTGYIKAAGSGETYGTQLLSNTAFENTTGISTYNATPISTTGGSTNNCLRVTTTSDWGGVYEQMTTTAGGSYYTILYQKGGTASSHVHVQRADSPYSELWDGGYYGGNWATVSGYMTTPTNSTITNLRMDAGLTGTNAYYDTASVKQVLTPATTGVTITSTSGGSTYNWASMDASFNLNATSYTYVITYPTNVYAASVTTRPYQVFYDGSRGAIKASTALLTADKDWYWDSTANLLFIYSASNPAGRIIEASQRNYGIQVSGKSYITIDGLQVEKANNINVNLTGSAAMTDITVQNSTITLAFNHGLASTNTGGGTYRSNLTITGNVVSYNGATGIQMEEYTKDVAISRNLITYNSQLYDSGAGSSQQYTAGIRLIGPPSGTVHISGFMISNNEVSYNGSGLPAGTEMLEGTGIWIDTVTAAGAVLRYNNVHHNRVSGIFFENDDGCEASYNLVWNNGLTGIMANSSILAHPTQNHKIWNNTVLGNSIATEGLSTDPAAIKIQGHYPLEANSCNNNSIKNNIALPSNGYPALSIRFGGENDGTYGSGNLYEYNALGPEVNHMVEYVAAYYRNTYAEFESAYGKATHSAQGNLLLISATDFHLLPGSPAINAGQTFGLIQDYEGKPIIGLPDIGAYEYLGGTYRALLGVGR